MRFIPHGSHKIEVDGRILIVHTHGPWNTEEIERYALDQEENVARLSGGPWGVLAYIHDEALHTPDSFKAMVSTVREHRAHGRCATALIINDVSRSADMVQSLFERLYAEAGEPCDFFDDENSARVWLQERLDSAQKP